VSSDGRILRLGECLVRFACQLLPEPARSDRYREWTAELPCILNDPDIPLAGIRAARMLLFAIDHSRGAGFHRILAAAQLRGRSTISSRLVMLNWVTATFVISGSGLAAFFVSKGNMTVVIISGIASAVGSLIPVLVNRVQRAHQRERDRLRAPGEDQ
jgi:hypothetical protein